MDIASIISALAACFALLYAARSTKIAKQAYKLALEQDQRNRPSIELYLVNSYINAGEHAVVWEGRDESGKTVSSGIYFYKMKTDNYISTKKMILLK